MISPKEYFLKAYKLFIYLSLLLEKLTKKKTKMMPNYSFHTKETNKGKELAEEKSFSELLDEFEGNIEDEPVENQDEDNLLCTENDRFCLAQFSIRCTCSGCYVPDPPLEEPDN